MSNPDRFTKKPVTITAVQFTEAVRDAYLFDKVPLPSGVEISSTHLHPPSRKVYSARAYIQTLEGRMEVSIGDWVITGVKGEHYPCKPDIFEATYSPAVTPTEAAAMAATVPSADAIVVDWERETDDPVAEMDAILTEYEKCMGITPGPEMARVVAKCKEMMMDWWGWHRDTIRAALVAAKQAPVAGQPAEPSPAWPKARDVGRLGDMSPVAHLRVGLDNDNDVYASVWDENGGGSIEFCTVGSGGGKSSRTRMALLALMVAMEADNTETPDRDWWARRNKAAPKGDSNG